MKQNYFDWLTPDKACAEDLQWVLNKSYQPYLDFLLPLVEDYQVKSVVEIGCRSGLLAARLPQEVGYTGLESNKWLRDKARKRNPGRGFEHPDGEDLHADLSLCFAFLKHVSLELWDGMLKQVLAAGKYACFDVQTLARDLDTGTDWYHVFVTPARLEGALGAAGHKVLHRQDRAFTLEGEGTATHSLLWTGPADDRPGKV